MASLDAVSELCSFIEGIYGPGKFPPMTEQSLAAWMMALEEVDDQALADAVMAHCREESWPPAPADLIRRCHGRRRPADRAHRPFELEAGGGTGVRSAEIAELVRRTRENLGNVVHLDERRQA